MKPACGDHLDSYFVLMMNGSHMRDIWLRSGALMVLVALGLAAAPSAAQAQSSPGVVPGVTKPYAHARPGVNQFGTVLELPVKEGQEVKKGDVLLRQDDRQELAELKSLQLEASSTARVDAAAADLKIQQNKLDNLLALQKNNSANPVEIADQQSKVIYGKAQLEIAKIELEKAKVAAQKQQFKVDQMTVKSAYDGRIEQIDVEIGDVTDPQKPVMTIAQNDPLKVEFFLQTEQAKRLHLGEDLQVRYSDEEKWMPAKVTYKAPIADAASDTQKIGLEMKNVDGRESGMQVMVKLPDDVAKVAQAQGSASPTPVTADASAKNP
jgi:RND family efflux transporter MFP subunit